MKYELPKEPEVGHRVITTNGEIYSKIYEGVPFCWFNKNNDNYASWPELLSMGVEDYTEPEKGEAYYRTPDEDYFGELKVYDGETWHHFSYGFKDERIENYNPANDDDGEKREWKKVGLPFYE